MFRIISKMLFVLLVNHYGMYSFKIPSTSSFNTADDLLQVKQKRQTLLAVVNQHLEQLITPGQQGAKCFDVSPLFTALCQCKRFL